eukprot:jgi/Botrbrau1/18264/Bobra.0459s0002.1
MAEVHVKLSLIFEDPEIERAFQDSISVSRRFRDSLVMVIGSACFAKFYFQKMSIITPTQHVSWLFCTASFVSLLCLTFGLVVGHPRIFKLKQKLMPIISVISNVSIKLIAIPSIITRSNGGTLWHLIPAFAATSRAIQAFTGLGCWSYTGKTFFFDLTVYTCNQALNLIWNRPECEILCKAQPGLRHWYQVIDDRISSLIGESASPIPVRGCIALRLFLQITIGGVIPILMAYWRELRERAEFLKNYRVIIVQPTLISHMNDCLLTCSIILMGAGCMAAAHMAFPEINDVPMMLVEGFLQ